MLGYDLPKKSCTLPGQVLKHCYAVVDKVLESQYPCIYKVGFTHCAYFRLHNTKFGYKHERDLWQKMIVIYAASEPVSPGFVEAAIIQRHKGFLIAFTLGKDQCHATIMQATFHDIVVYDRGSDRGVIMYINFSTLQNPLRSGQKGCRNIRDGGETIDADKFGPYLVYIIFRSFRIPPPCK